MTDTDTTTHPVVLINAGRRRTVKNTTVYAAVRESDGYLLMFKKRVGAGSIGTRYEVQAKDPEGTSVFIDTAKHLGRIPSDDPRLIVWTAEDEWAGQDEARARTERKAASIDPLEAVLADLSRATSGLTRPQRRALATRLLEALYL